MRSARYRRLLLRAMHGRSLPATEPRPSGSASGLSPQILQSDEAPRNGRSGPGSIAGSSVGKSVMEHTQPCARGEPWNKGKIVGQKASLRLKDIWTLRVRLRMDCRVRELALFSCCFGTRSWRARSATWALRLTTPWRWRSRRRFDALTASARGRSPARELVRGPTQSPRVHACRCDRTVCRRGQRLLPRSIRVQVPCQLHSIVQHPTDYDQSDFGAVDEKVARSPDSLHAVFDMVSALSQVPRSDTCAEFGSRDTARPVGLARHVTQRGDHQAFVAQSSSLAGLLIGPSEDGENIVLRGFRQPIAKRHPNVLAGCAARRPSCPTNSSS